jgi:hypothetical protein
MTRRRHGESGPQRCSGRRREPRQGRMTSHRRIISTLLLTAALIAVTPVLAAASSLLSGYGGPGEGSQELLGATLLNGPPAGSSDSFRYGERPGATRPGGTEPSSANAGAANAESRRSQGRGHGGKASAGAVRAYQASSAREAAAAGSETLGLSTDDFLYILLALAVLVITGVLTGRLARGERKLSNTQGNARETRVAQ